MEEYNNFEKREKAELSTSDARRARIKKMLTMKGTILALGAPSGQTGLIVENDVVEEERAADILMTRAR